MREYIRRYWRESKLFKRVLVIVLIYTVLRTLMQVMLVVGALMPGQEAEQALPDDLRIYLEAASHLQQQQDLYPTLPLERMEFYQYAPSYALAFTPFLALSTGMVVVVQTALHLAGYVLLHMWWGRIFERLKLERAKDALAWTLPVWLVFSAFWGDLGYLNIYLFMALLATLLIEALLAEKLGWALLWLSLILQMKPQWAFPIILPLFLGQYRFFAKLVVGGIAGYIGIAAVTTLLVGVDYGVQQHLAYFRLLTGLSNGYPWRTPDMPFLGYNHSITQIVVYVLGNTPGTLQLATVIKALILIPLAVVVVRNLRNPQPPAHLSRSQSSPLRSEGENDAQRTLNLTFVFYLAAFIWLDVVWELTLGIAVFTYLMATTDNRRARLVLLVVFLPYALIDFWQLISFIVFGPDVVVPGPYVLTDPSIYLPITMIVTVVFYGVLVARLRATSPRSVRLREGEAGWSQASTKQA